MKARTFGNRWSPLNGRRFESGSSNRWMSAAGGKRYDRYRAKIDDEPQHASLEPAPNGARRIALDEVAVKQPLENIAEKQQRVALNAWEDEGGKVKLKAPESIK